MRFRLFLALCLVTLALAGCEALPDPGEPVRDPARISMSVEVDEPVVAVSLSPLERADQGTLQHEVVVSWQGAARVILDDARFTHHVNGLNGDLVLAGRGCGADWDDVNEMVLHICTQDLQIIELEPGESHAYPVRIHPEVGPLQLTPGTYVAEETIGWEQDGDQGQFTLTLTYEVE